MTAVGVAMTPNISINADNSIFFCVRQSFFIKYGIVTIEEEVSNSSLSSTTIGNTLANLAASCLNKRLKRMEGANSLYGSYDKGY